MKSPKGAELLKKSDELLKEFNADDWIEEAHDELEKLIERLDQSNSSHKHPTPKSASPEVSI